MKLITMCLKRYLSKKYFFISLLLILLIALANSFIKSKKDPHYTERKYKVLYRNLQNLFGNTVVQHLPIPDLAAARQLDFAKLNEKVKNPPKWAIEEIDKSLSVYKLFSKEDVIKTYEKLTLGHFATLLELKDGKVTYKNMSPDEDIHPSMLYAIKYYQNLLHFLYKKGYIKDITLILSVADTRVGFDQSFNINEMTPIFVPSKNTETNIDKDCILIPDWQNLISWYRSLEDVDKANSDFPWEEKADVIFWRGGPADVSGYRHKVVKLSADLKRQKIDAQFTYGPNATAEFTKLKDHIKYKYQLNIDGYSAAYERPVWQLYSNSVVLKQKSHFTQWYYNALEANKHYIDVGNNPDELLDIVSNYSDEELFNITMNGREFVKNNLMPEDMFAYIIILLQKYEKLQKNIK